MNAYYFTHKKFNAKQGIDLASHYMNHLYSKLTITPKHSEIEKIHSTNIVKQMSIISAGLMNKNIFKYQTAFSTRLDKKDGDDQVFDEFELYIHIKNFQKRTQSDIDFTDFRSQLENKFKTKRRKIVFADLIKLFQRPKISIKTSELNGSRYVSLPIEGSAFSKIKDDNKKGFHWSLFAEIQRCEICHPKRVSIYRQYFDKLNIDGSDSSMCTNEVMFIDLKREIYYQ